MGFHLIQLIFDGHIFLSYPQCVVCLFVVGRGIGVYTCGPTVLLHWVSLFSLSSPFPYGLSAC